MKIIDYMIVYERDFGFEDEVKDYIKEGWQPFGGVSIIDECGRMRQVMVKYKENK